LKKNSDFDWRKIKKNLIFKECKIPKKIEEYCLALVKKLNLKFGAIDLVFSTGCPRTE
jgi:glutathione synthase/RimK-type ligase-like ATP-grasp enzyme